MQSKSMLILMWIYYNPEGHYAATDYAQDVLHETGGECDDKNLQG